MAGLEGRSRIAGEVGAGLQASVHPDGPGGFPAREEPARVVGEAGLPVLEIRLEAAFLLVVIGATKFTPWEAAAIEPLVRNSPFLSWLPQALGLQGASNLIGAIEIATGLAIAARRLSPTVSAIGSLAAAGTFLTTLSFLFTTPGALSPTHPASGFLMKDIILLGASVATAAEAARAARARHEPVQASPRPQPA